MDSYCETSRSTCHADGRARSERLTKGEKEQQMELLWDNQ